MIVPQKLKNAVLLAFSLLFYAWGEPVYVLLMIFSIISNYICARGIEANGVIDNHKRKRAFLSVSLVINILALFFFKYIDFAINTVNTLLNVNIKNLNLPLPVGISFYTFQVMSYVIDVYRKDVKAQKNIVNFATYVTMFPQLIAGPIVRYSDIESQLENRTILKEDVFEGIWRFVKGLSKKVLIANSIGVLWDYAYANINATSVLTAWLGVIAFAFQIYYDFSGYSDMAIGMGKMFGFRFEENFNLPYISKTVTEFWRRWHISLGTWFKEYLYIPLGGSRKGKWRTYLNLLIVWLCTGLWHGASFNFVLWGLFYFILLVLEKTFLYKPLNRIKVAGNIYTLFFVLMGWVLFATGNLSESIQYYSNMFGFGRLQLADSIFVYNLISNLVLLTVAFLCTVKPVTERFNSFVNKNIRIKTTFIIILFILSVAYLTDATYNPFLYFRF